MVDLSDRAQKQLALIYGAELVYRQMFDSNLLPTQGNLQAP